ncbi:MAG: hypothetical protein IJC76_02200 [Lachnospiraceae bacterium]|nr:hypothetical protein [Lachnospiraceae bacterium]
MPHINRIRVNNVKYNFGTQYYDDFLMRFNGKNTIYDLANGGGKSVLMLLLFQNLIPNCTLDDKQPIEKLFRTSDGSKTIHSLIEWNLSDIHVKDNYKYMLTGFCARKAKESDSGNRDNASIEYFNYCIFYREYNDNDIKNLPLKNGKERVTYSGLKNYLKELERKDLSLSVKIFEKKSDYQRFISDYGLYESEWEIIRGINKTEGHVRTYFETNYRNTRKVVEDLLIEEIIQKSFMNKYGNQEEDTMAQTLLDIKDKLIELSEKKAQIENFDRQQEIIEAFVSRISSIKQMYFGKENIESQVCKIYNTIRMKEEKYNTDRDSLVSRLEEVRASINDLARLCDTAKVMKEKAVIDQMNEKLEDISKDADELKNVLEAKKTELKFKESGNDYLDYIHSKMEADSIREAISARKQDSSAILIETEHFVTELFARNKVKLSEIDENLAKEEAAAEKENSVNEELTKKERELAGNQAVLEFKYNNLKNEYDEKSSRVAKRMSDLGVIVSSTIQNDIKNKQRELQSLQNKKSEILESVNTEKENEKKLLILMETGKLELDMLSSKEKELTKLDKASRERRERFEKISSVYADKKIENMHMDVIRQIAEKEQKLKHKEEILKNLKNNISVPMSPNMKGICEYIERYHGDICVHGAKYLSTKSEEERETIINRIPILPYSIVILKNFERVIEDTKLLDMNDGMVPDFIIDEDAIRQGKDIINNDNIIVSMKKREYIFNNRAMEAELSSIEEEIKELTRSLRHLYEYEEVIREDYVFIKNFTNTSDIEDMSNIKESLKEMEIKFEQSKEDYNSCLSTINVLNESLLECDRDIDRICADIAEMEIIIKENSECEILEKELTGTKAELENLIKEHKNIAARLEAALNQAKNRAAKIKGIKEQRLKIEDDWNNKYKIYYKEGHNVKISGDYETVVSKLNGLIDALRDENSDLADKEKLLKSYEDSMNKALENIRYRETSEEELKKSYEANELLKSDNNILWDIKSECRKINDELENIYREMDDLRSKRDKSEGGISQGINNIIEKYGVFDEEGIETDKIDEFINTQKVAVKGIEEMEIRLAAELKEFDNFAGKQIILRDNLERILNSGNINISNYSGYVDEGVDLYAATKEISEKYDLFTKQLFEKKQEFDGNKRMLITTLNTLNAAELANEIENNVVFPDSVEATTGLVTRLNDTNMCLELEKERVSKGIEDMERIKDNFENQCIQSCIKIKTELERLPKLSKINMDGENISIIDLRIPYVNEESYKERMSAYIDETANEADALKENEEKLKYIRSRLTWKKLFSVIVTDMNGIRLKLYKRERIAENSRYLPYEEAVGSTGQSQGIYIQFLVAVINYISSVNSRGAEASGLKKVIFIDNPFGAAKDVYIWEPIFKLLNTNNVQLVVPARGATPAITGRFDVNYILGQKLIDGRQQTVVVDYFSNVDSKTMEYTTLSYEQTSMF